MTTKLRIIKSSKFYFISMKNMEMLKFWEKLYNENNFIKYIKLFWFIFDNSYLWLAVLVSFVKIFLTSSGDSEIFCRIARVTGKPFFNKSSATLKSKYK